MKKTYLLIIISLFASQAYAQSAYTINTKLTAVTDMVTASNTDVTGDTVEFFNADEYSTIFAPLLVINSGGTTDNIRVRRTALNVVSGSSNFFCWDLCYGSGTSLSTGTVSIDPGDTSILFSADYDPSGNIGTSYVQYKFFNNTDTTEFATVIIKYTSGILGITEEPAAITNVYPNPATSVINFDYILEHNNGSIMITDLTGKIVRTAILPVNTTRHTFNLDGLNDGIYIYAFYEGNRVVSTKKFIVNK